MIQVDKFINDTMWYLWVPIQVFNGKSADTYWSYGLNRFNRAVILVESREFSNYLNVLRK